VSGGTQANATNRSTGQLRNVEPHIRARMGITQSKAARLATGTLR
jgi:hypothetical protein